MPKLKMHIEMIGRRSRIGCAVMMDGMLYLVKMCFTERDVDKLLIRCCWYKTDIPEDGERRAQMEWERSK
jgi:hypothetical protein